MGKTFRRERTKERDYKFDDKRTGYVGENTTSEDAVRWMKKREHRHNRRAAVRNLRGEIDDLS